MKKLIIILMLAVMGTVSFAQDTAYISRDKTTALFFKSAVRIIGNVPSDFNVVQKENGLITLKAEKADFTPVKINVQDVSTTKVYHIPVQYSYGRAGRSIEIGEKAPVVTGVVKAPETNDALIGDQLAAGKRSDVVDHEKTGGIKAWVSKISLAGNKVFFRLDVRNKSNLPYDVDFIRFYIRDLKTVARMATHEQEIVPVYASLHKKTTLVRKQEMAKVFAFHRFSLAEDQALNVEIYERHGNRHLYLQIRQKDLDNLQTLPVPVARETILAMDH
ncbi:DUF4138 domain-containing protein [Mucilaginibacter paludis]|nr:DUF4138 domain-containing protein [Mucilaginibacter paludis]